MIIRRAFLHMLLARQASVLILLVAMVFLGRLLGPEAFGVFAAMLAVVGLLETLAGFGVAPYLIRQAKLTSADLQAGQGLTLTLACSALAVLLLAIALVPTEVWPAEGREVLTILALTLPLLAVISTLEAALLRTLKVDTVARLNVARQAADSAIAIALAVAGFGAAALAYGVLANRIVGALGFLGLSRSGIRFAPSWHGWGPFAIFARSFLGAGLALRAGDAAVAFVLARMLGLDMLGQFNRAKRVMALLDETILAGLQPVVLPSISRSLDAGVGADRVYLLKLEHLSGLCWPAFGFIALMADQLVFVLLGPQWGPAADAVRVLALAGLALPITKMSAEVFVALDAMGQFSRIQAAHQVLRVTLVAIGATISLEAACLGAALSTFMKAGVITRVLKRRTGYATADFVSLFGRAGIVAVFTLTGPLMVLWIGANWPAVVVLAVATLSAGFGWIAGSALAGHALLSEVLLALGARGMAARLGRSS